jgi:chromosome segregation protein
MFPDHGAHFYRCDFQVHTPRDTNWQGDRALSEEDRNAYARNFVAACRKKELNAVAITDHHDFVMFPYLKTAAEAERDADGEPIPPEDRLVVFPGLELTLGVPCQAILILDADFPIDRLPSVLEILGVDPIAPTAETLPPVVPLDEIQNFADIYGLFDARLWLRSRYIVLPNVTDGGHGTVMRKGMQAKYKSMPCVGGYLDGTVETKVGTGNRRIFDGLDDNWGNHRIALFQTSDSRSDSYDDLGKHSTWVKWAKPTAEALRQACLAADSRISQKEPQLPSIYISQVSVSNSKFLGPVNLFLNPQYSAFIGGRGTGKSTVLDYLRWGLCDQPASVDTDDIANPLSRRQRLIDATLKPLDGQVEVHFTINTIPHVVRRYAENGETFLKVGDGELERVREDDVRSLLPIHAYSQKQLSSVSVRVDELNRFVTAPIRATLDDIDRSISDVSGRLRENYATLQRFRDLQVSIDRSALLERSLADQAANLRASLSGLSDEDRALLDYKPAVDATRAALHQWRGDVDQAIESVDALSQQILRTANALAALPGGPSTLAGLAETVRTEDRSLLSSLASALETAVTAARATLAGSGTLATQKQAAETELERLDAAYEDVKARSTAHEAKLAELSGVEARRTTAAKLLAEQQRELAGLGDPQVTHARLRSELIRLYGERSGCIEGQCREVTRLSGGLLQAETRRGHGLSDVEVKFRAVTAGSGIRGSRFEDFFRNIRTDSDPLTTWETVLTELETLMLAGKDKQVPSEQTPNLTRLGIPEADQRRIQGKLSTDGWLDLALTPIEDEPIFRYESKEKEYIAFEQASAGQQATALLRVLLAQTGMPLIIDQPEEDLDSQVIQDIVTQLWKAKRGRQVIFASHNANLVVNGDAELVVVCDYLASGDQSRGRIKLEGAIDVPEVRDAITHVMEGGEKAFRLRKDKYGF